MTTVFMLAGVLTLLLVAALSATVLVVVYLALKTDDADFDDRER